MRKWEAIRLERIVVLVPIIPDREVITPLPSALNAAVSDIIANVVGGLLQRPIGP